MGILISFTALAPSWLWKNSLPHALPKNSEDMKVEKLRLWMLLVYKLKWKAWINFKDLPKLYASFSVHDTKCHANLALGLSWRYGLAFLPRVYSVINDIHALIQIHIIRKMCSVKSRIDNLKVHCKSLPFWFLTSKGIKKVKNSFFVIENPEPKCTL